MQSWSDTYPANRKVASVSLPILYVTQEPTQVFLFVGAYDKEAELNLSPVCSLGYIINV